MSLYARKNRCGAKMRRAEDGYTLLEFLAAFTVLSLFLAVGLAAVGMALRSDQQAAFVALATPLARAKLAAAGVDYPLQTGVAAGSFGNGYLWRAEVRNYRVAAVDRMNRLRAYWVEVTVAEPAGRAGRSLSLASVSLARGARP
jgi:type II secretory pathway pseudopilin PulG